MNPATVESAPPVESHLIAGVLVDARSAEPGWVLLEGGVIAARGRGAAGRPEAARVTDLGEQGLVFPGFVDLHCHGGGGAAFPGGDPVEIAAAAGFHRAHGTVAQLASLVSAPPSELIGWCAALADHIEGGSTGVVGIHLEGPFLAEGRCGAHDPAHLLDPDPALFDALVEAGRGHVAVITIAPERSGATAVMERAARAGVRVAVGHTDADHPTVARALGAGASIGTHLFNAMSPADHRHPGAVGALLDDPHAVLELIADGVHVDPAIVRVAFAAAPQRIALITDAMNAAGMSDGEYRFGPIEVRVVDGVARLADGDALAGSTLTMDRAVRHALAMGVHPSVVSEAATLTPAAVLAGCATVGATRRGFLTPGSPADLVLLPHDPTGHVPVTVLP